MLLLVFLGVSVLAVPLAGGRLASLASLRLRLSWLLALALGIQIMVLSLLHGPPDVFREVMHVASYALAIGFLVINRRVPGMWLIGAGGAMNVIAIAANGGIMPAAPSAFATAGLPLDPTSFHNSMVLASPRLAFLGDVFAVPASWPLHNVFSPGDVVMVLGAALLVHRVAGSRLIPSGAGQFAPLLRQSAFMRLWTAQAISNLGDWTYALAVASTLAQRTHSPRALAFLLILQVGPATLSGILFGPLADRHSRTTLMVGTDIVRGLAVASLLVGSPSTAHIYVVAMCLGVFGAIFQPSLQASIPNVVEDTHLAAANSLVGATYYGAVMAGPALGGFLVAQIGIGPIFLLNAASFGLSAVLVAGIRLPRPRSKDASGSARLDLIEGMRYVAATPIVRGLLIVMGVVIVAAATKAPLESLFVLGVLSLGATSLGLVAGCWGLGMLLGAAAAPALVRRWPKERLFMLSVAAVGLSILSASRATSLGQVLLAWLIAGGANAIGDVSYETLLQERTPDAVRGRVFAAAGAVISGGFLVGALAAGWLGGVLGVRAVYALSGGMLLCAALLARVLVPSPKMVSEEASVTRRSTQAAQGQAD